MVRWTWLGINKKKNNNPAPWSLTSVSAVVNATKTGGGNPAVAFIIVFEDETELHAFYEKGITYLS